MSNQIMKWFPSDLDLLTPHFLNDKNMSGELLSILLSRSKVRYRSAGIPYTFCPKESVNFTQIAKEVLHCSKSTIYNKLNYLIERQYVIPHEDGYEIQNIERTWKSVPLETLKYLEDSCSLAAIKVYLYLGIMFNWKQRLGESTYNFTKEELIKHCGIIRGRQREGLRTVDNLLNTLVQLGLINYTTIYLPCEKENEQGPGYTYQNYQLCSWTTEVKKAKIEERIATKEDIVSAQNDKKLREMIQSGQIVISEQPDQKCNVGLSQPVW